MILAARGLTKKYGETIAVGGVDFELAAGQTAAIVGGSGSGKSTLARLLVRLEAPSAGSVLFEGSELHTLKAAELRKIRRRLQIVFQDPGTALDPRMRVNAILNEPLEIHGLDRPAPSEQLEQVGLDRGLLDRYPHQLSGGQKQRVAIARALALSPSMIILDEPTSALDRESERALFELLFSLKEKRALTFLLISHDLRVVRAFAQRVLVMDRGRIVEDKPTGELFSDPMADPTRALIRAAERG